MFRFLVFVMVASVVFMACETDTERDTEIVQPNPDLTMSYADFRDNAPGAPTLAPGLNELQLLHCTNIRGKQFYEWTGILAGEGFLAGDQDVGTPNLMLIVHSTLVRIPDGQSGDVQTIYVHNPNGALAFTFPFSVNRPSVILKRTRVALTSLAADLGGVGQHTGLADFDDISVDTTDLFPCPSIEQLDPSWVVYETNTAVETVPIAEVTALKFPRHLITINGTETKMRDLRPARFYANETDANAYRDYRSTHRGFFPIGDWYSIGLYLKGHGARDGTYLTMAHTGLDPIQNFVEEVFPDTAAEQRAFVREGVSTIYKTDIDNGNLYFKFSPPFDTRAEAEAFNHETAAAATTYTKEKLELRFGFETDVRTAQAQRNMFAGGDFGTGFFDRKIAIYTDGDNDDIVRGVASVDSNGFTNTVTLGGVQLTQKSLWTYRPGANPGNLATDLRIYFGFTNTWGRTSNPTAPGRSDPLPVLLVLNTTAGTFSTTDPVNLYSIAAAHKIKRYASAALAQTGQTTIETGASIYTYFNVTR